MAQRARVCWEALGHRKASRFYQLRVFTSLTGRLANLTACPPDRHCPANSLQIPVGHPRVSGVLIKRSGNRSRTVRGGHTHNLGAREAEQEVLDPRPAWATQ